MAEDQHLAAALLYLDDVIEESECLLLVKDCEGKIPVLSHSKYERVAFDSLDEEECLAEFFFKANDIHRLFQVLKLPEKVVCFNSTTSSKSEGLCMLLRRFAYPCRYSDLMPRFGRSKSEICLIVNEVMSHIARNFGQLLEMLDQEWLQSRRLQEYARAVHALTGALKNFWGFINGTVRLICPPKQNQRSVFNGHNRVHALKYQSVVGANGLMAYLYGPCGMKSIAYNF